MRFVRETVRTTVTQLDLSQPPRSSVNPAVWLCGISMVIPLRGCRKYGPLW